MLITDSICVKVLAKDRIVYAVGNELGLYDELFTGTTTTTDCKLKGKIHGIDFYRNKYLFIYGEREFKILNFIEHEATLLYSGHITDWISSAKFLNNEESCQICLVTAHSVALLISFDYSSRSCSLISKHSCTDKSTMYCSFILSDTWNNITIFGGNAFGELIIWKPTNIEYRCPVIHKIVAHKGAVFSIDVELSSHLMVTTSDDRSVKLWSIANDEYLFDAIDWSNTKIESKNSGFGHTARVFKAKFVKTDNDPIIISVGEDSYICVWNHKAELLYKRKHHFGATIWDFDIHDKTQTIFTVGSDGSIFKFNLNTIFKTENTICIQKITSLALLKDQHLAKIKSIKDNNLIGITNKNFLVIRNQENDWEFIEDFSQYKCTVLETFKNLIAIGGYKILTIYEFTVNNDNSKHLTKLFNESILENTIRSFIFLSDTEYLVCDDKGQCIYTGDNFMTRLPIEIPSKSKEKWITSAIKCGPYLIVSNRQGNIYMYSFEIDSSFSFRSSLKHVHGMLGVTYMIEDVSNNDNFCYIKTCGHDSTIKTIELDKLACKIKVIYTEVVPIGWIEGIYVNEDFDRFIYGFNDNHFVVWEEKYDIVMQVPCGGGHRCWDFFENPYNKKNYFVFIKNKQLFETSQNLRWKTGVFKKLTNYSWHIKSCNIVQSIPLMNKSSIILFSGGDDNLLKCSLFKTNKMDELFRLTTDLFLHISNIKTLCFIEKRKSSNYLVFSAGGRAQICVTEIDINKGTIREISNFMLKSNDFDRKYKKNTQQIDFDPETRFMSIDLLEVPSKNNDDDNSEFEIFIGCSDGYIRKFLYNEHSSFVISDEKFYNVCILHVKIIKLKKFKLNLLLTTATDGYLCFWDINEFSKDSMPIFKIKHHDSGVNSLDYFVEDTIIKLATGGDDQNVVFTKLEVKDTAEIRKLSSSVLRNLHCSQVNGICFSVCGAYAYTTGVDQFICKVDFSSMKLLNRYFTCVADVKGVNSVTLNDNNFCIVYGSGLEICKL